MAPLTLPAHLGDAVRRSDDVAFRAWVDALPAVVAAAARRWSLQLGDPYQPGGACSWVAPAGDPAGRRLVLKVGWRHDEAQDEAAGLPAWAGQGAVRLYENLTDASTMMLLLERCEPGTTLRMLPAVEQDVVIAGLLNRLWRTPAGAHPFRPLSRMCADWADACEARPTPLDPGLSRAGIALLRELPLSAASSVLLCTDLHAGNVIATHREPWLVIDPKPYVGDPHYDVLQHLLNNREQLFTDPRGQAHRMADLAGLDRDRVVAWLFARSVRESFDQAELRPVATALAALV
ncbi:aminoglycoside phosphotransferase family protein [Kineosporia sp. NBRC 101731]|uniref:aminoglycoside phosphotransferase family protein n=1 Tax=Kineosporia sp. NBRC 101731 TaxID=3032199 RepID=UPI0024A3D3C3|nr:aminoglycoside phosphotransferase family protein [Kineosporia sp. NBRC 101731]GLY30894.1 streptomycin 6-kinase [Kineosporia sp. NBRC 101731]